MRLKKRLDSAIDTLHNMLGRKYSADAVNMAAKGVERLRKDMEKLRKLVSNGEGTQFVIVTVAT